MCIEGGLIPFQMTPSKQKSNTVLKVNIKKVEKWGSLFLPENLPESSVFEMNEICENRISISFL